MIDKHSCPRPTGNEYYPFMDPASVLLLEPMNKAHRKELRAVGVPEAAHGNVDMMTTTDGEPWFIDQGSWKSEMLLQTHMDVKRRI